MALRLKAEGLVTFRHKQTGINFGIKVVFGKYRAPDGFDEYSRQVVYVTTSRAVTIHEVYRALNYFDRWCCCMHDCCGCWHGGAGDVVKVRRNGRRWEAVLRYARNY